MRKNSGKNQSNLAKAPARSRVWNVDETSFGIRVPTTPENTQLIQELRKASDPFASYHEEGRLIGLSWILPKNQFKGLWQTRGMVEGPGVIGG